MVSRRVLVIGGSTRAAADSIRRAGWEPVCADLFADLDLRDNAEVIPVRAYPDSLPDDIASIRADAWFYCGALENHPEIIERILATNASIGPLLGATPSALKLVRNPHWVMSTLAWEGHLVLDVAAANSAPPADGNWLQKPLKSAGGRLIRVWDRAATAVPFEESHYFQKIAVGIGMSALFRFGGGEPDWLGASRELSSPPASHPGSAFTYCGSIGPLSETIPSGGTSEVLSASTKAVLIRIASILARQAKGLRGLIGIDFRLDGDDVWVTEINPRYTASVELLELATGRSFLNPGADPSNAQAADGNGASPAAIIVKQILYAKTSLIVPDLRHWVDNEDPWRVPCLADIPVPGIVIEPGWPICTVLAAGSDRAAAETALQHRIRAVQALFQLGERGS